MLCFTRNYCGWIQRHYANTVMPLPGLHWKGCCTIGTMLSLPPFPTLASAALPSSNSNGRGWDRNFPTKLEEIWQTCCVYTFCYSFRNLRLLSCTSECVCARMCTRMHVHVCAESCTSRLWLNWLWGDFCPIAKFLTQSLQDAGSQFLDADSQLCQVRSKMCFWEPAGLVVCTLVTIQ